MKKNFDPNKINSRFSGRHKVMDQEDWGIQ